MRFFGKCVSICLIALFFAVVFLTVAFADGGDGYGDKIESFDVSRDESSSVTVNLYRKDGQYFLVVSGEGNMREFSSFAELPWGEYADGIVGITVEAGVKNLTDLFLYNCSALEELWVYERYLTFIADKQYIPFAVKIYGHFNSTANLFVYENYPERFFPICDFKDGVCAECEFVCENHSGGVPSCTENGKCQIAGSNISLKPVTVYPSLSVRSRQPAILSEFWRTMLALNAESCLTVIISRPQRKLLNSHVTTPMAS